MLDITAYNRGSCLPGTQPPGATPSILSTAAATPSPLPLPEPITHWKTYKEKEISGLRNKEIGYLDRAMFLILHNKKLIRM